MNELKNLIFELCRLDAAGNVDSAAKFAEAELKKYCTAERKNGLTVIGYLKGESDYTVMLDAHIDQISMIVTDIDENGFLTVAKCGGIDLRMLPARRVTVHGKEDITAVFCSTPPHLSENDASFDDISALKIDTLLGSRAKELVSVGDTVTFAAEPTALLSDRITARSLDDRAAVACLIETARRLKGEKLPVSVAFVLSDAEELGMRGVRPAAFSVNPDEAVAVDVSFGDGIGISPEECGKLGKGGMIGVSASLDRKITNKLISLAKTKEIPYQTEGMGDRTGTDADMIGISREGVPVCTLSIPIRNMHTEVEMLDINDCENVCRLLCEYILSGGIANA